MEESKVCTSDQNGTTPGEEAHSGTQSSVKRASLISPLLHTRPVSSPQQTLSSAGTERTEEKQGGVPEEPTEECPVCTEPFQTQGDRVAAVLHCNHPVCQRCLESVQRASRDPSRLRCPLCRQTTPLPQWDMLILQEGMYSGGVDVCQAGRGDEGTDLRPWSRYRLMRIHSVYLYVTVLVLLLVMLGYLLSRDKA